MLPGADELIRKGVDEKTTDGHGHYCFPGSHHPAERDQVAVAGNVSVPHGLDLRSRVRLLPTPSTVRVGVGVAAALVDEGRNEIEPVGISKGSYMAECHAFSQELLFVLWWCRQDGLRQFFIIGSRFSRKTAIISNNPTRGYACYIIAIY